MATVNRETKSFVPVAYLVHPNGRLSPVFEFSWEIDYETSNSYKATGVSIQSSTVTASLLISGRTQASLIPSPQETQDVAVMQADFVFKLIDAIVSKQYKLTSRTISLQLTAKNHEMTKFEQ